MLSTPRKPAMPSTHWFPDGFHHLGCALLCAFALSGAAAREAPAQVASLEGLSASDDARPELAQMLPQNRLVGKSRLNVYGFQIYDARLWAETGFKADNLRAQSFALELAYLRSFASSDVAARSIVEMRRSADISPAQAKIWTQELQRVIPDVKKGDRIMGVNKPGVGVQFLVNGKPSGEVRDLEFAQLFFGIWLSPKTSQPKLRSALLVGTM